MTYITVGLPGVYTVFYILYCSLLLTFNLLVYYFILYSLKVFSVCTHSIPHGYSTLKHVGTSINKISQCNLLVFQRIILTWEWFLAYNKLQDWHNKGAAADACTFASHYEGNIPITHWQLYTNHKNIPLTTRIYDGSLGNMEFVVCLLSKFANKWVETFWPSIKALPGKEWKYTFRPQICLWATQHCVVGQVGWHTNGIHVMVSSQRQVFINNTNIFIL